MQKKILITFLFKEGAGPVFTLEMARGLAQNGCEVHALLSSKISNKKDWENEKAFKSITFIDNVKKIDTKVLQCTVLRTDKLL